MGGFVDQQGNALTSVFGLAFGKDGNLYATQQYGGSNSDTQIWKVNTTPVNDKIELTKVGTGVGLYNSQPINTHAMDIAPDGVMHMWGLKGDIFTVDLTTGLATYVASTYIDGTGNKLFDIMDIAYSPDGTAYACANQKLYKIEADGTTTTISSLGANIMGLAFDPDGTLYGSSFDTPGKLYTINTSNAALTEIAGSFGTQPHGGDIYIAYAGWGTEISYLSGSDKTAEFSLVTTADTVSSTARAALSDSGITLQTDSLSFEAEVDESIPRITFNLEFSSLNLDDGAITTTEEKRDTRQKLLYYSVDQEGEVSNLSFDPLVNAGARFYDLDGDGVADYLSLTLVDGGFGDKDGEKNGVIVDPSTAATVALDPVIKANEGPFNLLTIADPDNAAPAALNLNATITSRGEAVIQIGYVVLDADEVVSAETILGDLDQLKERVTILFSSLELEDVTLANAFQFSRDLLIRNGQSVRFFSLEDTTLDKLSSLDDSRFSFLKSTENSDGSFSFSSGSGLSFDLALNANDQGLSALVAQAQDLAPVLNVTPFTNGETLNGTLVLAREASFDAVTGLYTVVDPTGLVMAADGSLIAPGAAGYAEAALRADNLYGGDEFKFSLANGKTEESSLAMENLGGYLAPYAKVQSNTFFAFAQANTDGISHFRSLGNNIWGLEDQLGGGDLDFDDQILGFNFTSITTANT